MKQCLINKIQTILAWRWENSTAYILTVPNIGWSHLSERFLGIPFVFLLCSELPKNWPNVAILIAISLFWRPLPCRYLIVTI